MDKIITKEWIQKAEQAGACYKSLVWLRKGTRTWTDLVRKNRSWAGWAMAYIPDCPIELEDTNKTYRSIIMVNKKEIKTDLSLLNHRGRVYVMIRRLDSSINLKGLKPYDKARVLVARPDCPNILKTLPEKYIELVKRNVSNKRWKRLTETINKGKSNG